jgi:uncharacterized protein involved in exopolysaccharide biosynthesis
MTDRSLQSDSLDSSREERGTTPGGITLLALSNTLLQHRRFILAVGIGAGLLAGVASLLKSHTYTVVSSFIIQNKDQSAAAGLAAQFGVDVSGIDPSQSPVLYTELMKMPDVLGRLVDSSFRTSTNKVPRPLADIWKISTKVSPALRREQAIDRLLKAVSTSVGLKVDVVTVNVVTEDPLLSAELNDALLQEVNRFNLQTRQSRASAERRFTEQRMHDIQTELRRVEDSVQTFFTSNRQSYLSASLELAKQRLTRRVDLLAATYSTLATSFERARIDEVRDTPLLTVIQQPHVPLRPDPRGTVAKAILTFILGLGAAAIFVLVRSMLGAALSSDDDDAREFSRLLDDTSQDVRRLRRAIPGLAKKTRAARTGS